ncbi:Hypothetical predicted protein [Podarcis lilfordi]|uniref:Uncharacterized protein n=1 Tax=Podarcis lilfordi TaxID=74358 RepID=A0AA35PDW2_9SAUR|nr:Hypothetical predicted protein [Podarcis lilfordi]
MDSFSYIGSKKRKRFVEATSLEVSDNFTFLLVARHKHFRVVEKKYDRPKTASCVPGLQNLLSHVELIKES